MAGLLFCGTAFILNVPLLLLHLWNIRRHPRLAIAGGLATMASLGTFALCEEPSPVTLFLGGVHKLSLTNFVYTFHTLVVDNTGLSWMIKYLIGTLVVVWHPAAALLIDTLLIGYAIFIAFQL